MVVVVEIGVDMHCAMRHYVCMTINRIAAATLTVAALATSALALSLCSTPVSHAEDVQPAPTTQTLTVPTDAATPVVTQPAPAVVTPAPAVPDGVLHAQPQPVDNAGKDVDPAPDITIAPCTMTVHPPYTRPDVCVDGSGNVVPIPRTGDGMVGGPGYKAPGETYSLPPCPSEDSSNCYWDATTRGNGQGTSFVNLNGVTYYAR